MTDSNNNQSYPILNAYKQVAEGLAVCPDPVVREIGCELIAVTIRILESLEDRVCLTGFADPERDAPFDLLLKRSELLARLRAYAKQVSG